ncbi:glycosyltransferase [Pyrobaculum neutrophilum]|uniref:Glycosyl transferase, group 1 n=1 Tax=Pyrobaculum neutrophilum (strain DSM 2338 / JCM 9278 / NBRC 100436 / V24Sta) TaxID=444157 RepID=B1YCF1_PYRNV|nr:glycosyltransferase [Pyrobaculum neutrophilum]ACB39464.1 glycosyl transferase, group 1 [Pyrobaculum neutrophilum V24Sta]
MRVLLVSPGGPGRLGGVEYVVYSLARALAGVGHRVVVLAGEPGVGGLRVLDLGGVEVHLWPVWSPGGAYHIPRRLGELRRYVARLAAEADVVHVHSVHAVFSVEAGVAAGEAGAPVVLSPHYHGGGHTPLREALWTVWRRRVAGLAGAVGAVVAASRPEAERWEEDFGVGAVVVPHGVGDDVFLYRWRGASSDYAVYAGRLERYKRVDKAYEVAAALGLRLLVVGDGPHLRALRRRLRGALFLPPQPRERYLDLLSGARYAINMSAREVYSIFVAEALAMGVPALLSREVAEIYMPGASGEVNEVTRAEVRPWSQVVPEVLAVYRGIEKP